MIENIHRIGDFMDAERIDGRIVIRGTSADNNVVGNTVTINININITPGNEALTEEQAISLKTQLDIVKRAMPIFNKGVDVEEYQEPRKRKWF